MLPKNIQPLLQDPSTMKYIEKLVTENPDKVKELIGKFVKTPKGKSENVDTNMESV
jgi:DNA-directed RNA polymerase subunit F